MLVQITHNFKTKTNAISVYPPYIPTHLLKYHVDTPNTPSQASTSTSTNTHTHTQWEPQTKIIAPRTKKPLEKQEVIKNTNPQTTHTRPNRIQ
jgi:hypothetical protein